MIWPGRNLALATLVPALMSLALLTPDSAPLRPALVGLDVLVALVALGDMATLLGSGKLRAERTVGAVASLGEPQGVELTLINGGRSGRVVRVRDDVPET